MVLVESIGGGKQHHLTCSTTIIAALTPYMAAHPWVSTSKAHLPHFLSHTNLSPQFIFLLIVEHVISKVEGQSEWVLEGEMTGVAFTTQLGNTRTRKDEDYFASGGKSL